METTVINFFGGPCVGKSTIAAGLFNRLKTKGVSCELVVEVTKGLSYEGHKSKLGCQPYIFGKQLHRLERLLGKVRFIVTDSPLLLSPVYNNGRYGVFFDSMVEQIFKTMDNINYLIMRNTIYDQSGRNESLAEAVEIDKKIKWTLDKTFTSYETISDKNRLDSITEALCWKYLN